MGRFASCVLVLLTVACGGAVDSPGQPIPDATDDALFDAAFDAEFDAPIDASEAGTDLASQDPAAEATETADEVAGDAPTDTPAEAIVPVCLAPTLPKSCIAEAVACTGLPSCGPTVTSCFQYGTEEFPQASWLVSDWLTAQTVGSATYAASWDTMRVGFSNGAWMITEFLPRPRALYFAPGGGMCAALTFQYAENSDNWGDADVARRYYLRSADGKLVVIQPRFLLSPGVWWEVEGYDVTCPDGTAEKWTFDQFQPLAYLLFGGENRDGKSFLPWWTTDGCELGEYRKECLHAPDIQTESSCNGDVLNVCKRGVQVGVDCAAKGKSCMQVPVGYSATEILYYHSFCWGGESCSEDTCDGTRIANCWGGVAEKKDCAQIGADCFVMPSYGPMSPAHGMCASAPVTACATAGYAATCDGDTAVRCDYYGYEVRIDCHAIGQRCAVGLDYTGASYAFCAPPGDGGPCVFDSAATCDGDVRNVCLFGGTKAAEDCKARYGKVCRTGTTGAACVEAASQSCTDSPNSCASCAGDRVTACGDGGLTLFDDCARQGLGPTQDAGRTCYAGPEGCGVCGQKDAAECSAETFLATCDGTDIVNCRGGHQVVQDCAEAAFASYVPGWCNVEPTSGAAYCEPLANASCDPGTTASTCEAGPVAVNCTAAKVLLKTVCPDADLYDCKVSTAGKAVCVQPDAASCDPAAWVAACSGAALVTCPEGFTVTTGCGSDWECGVGGSGAACHQPGAVACDGFQFDYRCDGHVAVSCQDGFVRKTDCSSVCAQCSCHSQTGQAWCAPDMP